MALSRTVRYALGEAAGRARPLPAGLRSSTLRMRESGGWTPPFPVIRHLCAGQARLLGGRARGQDGGIGVARGGAAALAGKRLAGGRSAKAAAAKLLVRPVSMHVVKRGRHPPRLPPPPRTVPGGGGRGRPPSSLPRWLEGDGLCSPPACPFGWGVPASQSQTSGGGGTPLLVLLRRGEEGGGPPRLASPGGVFLSPPSAPKVRPAAPRTPQALNPPLNWGGAPSSCSPPPRSSGGGRAGLAQTDFGLSSGVEVLQVGGEGWRWEGAHPGLLVLGGAAACLQRAGGGVGVCPPAIFNQGAESGVLRPPMLLFCLTFFSPVSLPPPPPPRWPP